MVVPAMFINSWRSNIRKPVIVWKSESWEVERFLVPLRDIAEVSKKVRGMPCYDYIFAAMLQRIWIKYVKEYIKYHYRRDREKLLSELQKLAATKLPATLWFSKRYIVINPLKILQVVAPLIEVLEPSDFGENLEETANWADMEAMRRAEEYSNSRGKYCGSGYWCEEDGRRAIKEVIDEVTSTTIRLMRLVGRLDYDMVRKYPATFIP